LDWLHLPLPGDRIIDGKSLRKMLEAQQPSPHEYLYYFAGETLMAVRDARYKYHNRRHLIYSTASLPVGFPSTKGPWLFDTTTDFNESYDISSSEPKVTERMAKALELKREEMKRNMRGWVN